MIFLAFNKKMASVPCGMSFSSTCNVSEFRHLDVSYPAFVYSNESCVIWMAYLNEHMYIYATTIQQLAILGGHKKIPTFLSEIHMSDYSFTITISDCDLFLNLPQSDLLPYGLILPLSQCQFIYDTTGDMAFNHGLPEASVWYGNTVCFPGTFSAENSIPDVKLRAAVSTICKDIRHDISSIVVSKKLYIVKYKANHAVVSFPFLNKLRLLHIKKMHAVMDTFARAISKNLPKEIEHVPKVLVTIPEEDSLEDFLEDIKFDPSKSNQSKLDHKIDDSRKSSKRRLEEGESDLVQKHIEISVDIPLQCMDQYGMDVNMDMNMDVNMNPLSNIN